MKKVLCVVAALMFVASASAEIQFFFTKGGDLGDGWGLDEVTLDAYGYTPLDASSWTGFDDFAGYALVVGPNGKKVPSIAPGTTTLPDVVIDPTVEPDGFAYLWVHFDQDELINTKINGLEGLGVTGASQVAWYYAWGSTGKRWDGEVAGLQTMLVSNPASLIAVTAKGLQALGAEDAGNLYYAETSGFPPVVDPQYNTALVGAVKCGSGLMTGYVDGISTDLGGFPHDLGWTFLNGVNCIPEPASLMLLGLAGLFLRRR